MNKSELIQTVADRTGLTRTQAAEVIGKTLDILSDALQRDEKVQLTGFGTFEPKHRPAHIGRHPITADPIEVPAHTTVSFRPAAALREAMEE